MGFLNFYELEVYKVCRAFRKRVSNVVREYFPEKEKYSLSDQVLRSSRSVTSNIAEGHGRFHYGENIQFCRISRGSLNETLEHLITAYDEKYISTSLLKSLKIDYGTCLKELNGYIKYLKDKKKGG